MEPKRTVLDQVDEAIDALDTAVARARDTFATLRDGGIAPTFHPEDEGPILP
jgi:hypothetical protein